jgi:1-acyl-sn-glycerol-3-phosphate acyltransferase
MTMRWKADHAFIPPRPSPFLIGLTRRLLPACLRSQDVGEVDYRPEDLQRLRDLGPARVAIFPNHPTGADPAILYDLGKRVGQPFYFLAARETFDIYCGLWGWILQRLGVYSIVRGTADRAAFKMTRELLTRPGTKLVVFPEGETYSQNDSLLPFHSGITQILFWALDDLREAGVQEPIYVLPMAVKYRYTQEMRPAIEAMLSRLETAVGLPPYSAEAGQAEMPTVGERAGYEDLYPRVRRIGAAVVSKLEDEYALPHNADLSLSARMDALKEAIIQRVSAALHVAPRGENLPDRMRNLINAFYQVTDAEPEALSPYDRHLREERRRRVQPLIRDLDRLANWIAMYDGYVAARPSTERMADLLHRLEIEALGPWPDAIAVHDLFPHSLLRGMRRCHVRLGEPVDVAARYADYRADKRTTVEALTRQFETAVQGLLDEMA